jgi:hypothetical protein
MRKLRVILRHAAARPITALLAIVPMAFALVGAWWDEHTHLGFTTWLSACRGAGVRFASVLDFSLQLLPFAVLGVLAGGLLLLIVAFAGRHRATGVAHCILPAHAGCALAMVPGLLLCASGVAWPLALGAELALAATAALCIDAVASGTLRTRRAARPS